jgi:hypothetical protein
MSALRRDLMRFLGPGTVTAIGNGGSGALVFRHDYLDIAKFVKYLPHRPDAVDGHEAHALLAKAEQVRLIHEVAGGLRHAVPVIHVTEIAGGYVMTAPVIEGRSPVERLLDGDVLAFAAILRRLLEAVGEHGYACRSSAASGAADLYIGRTRRRLDYLAKHLTGPPGVQLAEILDSVGRVGHQRGLLPTKVYFPVHGDLNLLNVIETDGGELIMVDQRGVLGDWDPMYDIGKMLITIWIQAGLEYGLYSIGQGGHDLSCQRATAALLSHGSQALRWAISGWHFGEQIERNPQRRWLRVLFAAAVHAICEAACRISVSRSALCTNPAREAAKACAYLSLGSRLLRDLEIQSMPELPFPGLGG